MKRRFESWKISGAIREYRLTESPPGILVTLVFDSHNRFGNPRYQIKMLNQANGQCCVLRRLYAERVAKREALRIAYSPKWLKCVGYEGPEVQ